MEQGKTEWAANIIDRAQKLAATCAKDWGLMLVVLAVQLDGDRAQESPPVEDIWLFYLDEIDPGTARLIVRNQRDYVPTVAHFVIWQVVTEPLHFLMEQKMLRGIKHRAESG